jgi:mRNA interferase HigB
MKILQLGILEDFIRKHADIKSSLESWLQEAKTSEWKNTMDIKNRYASASFLKENYVIFNIKGNSYVSAQSTPHS